MGAVDGARGVEPRPKQVVRSERDAIAPARDLRAPDRRDAPSPERGSRVTESPSAPTRDAEAGRQQLGLRPGGLRGAHAGPEAPVPRQRERPSDDTTRDLSEQGRRTREGRSWDPDAPLSKGRNAHHSNTKEEMHKALDGDFNWLEGDLRVDDAGRLVMAHDADKEGDGLRLDQWLEIGRHAERGMKVDIKEEEALPELLDQLEASGIPHGRLMINFGTSQVSADQVRDMRRRFPEAHLAINPTMTKNDYAEEDLDRAVDYARVAGGRVAFPLRWDAASDEAIGRLGPHGNISIWTSDANGTPDDAAEETRALRERGVDGVIDLGPRASTADKFAQLYTNIRFELFGDGDPATEGAKMLAKGVFSPLWFAVDHGGDVLGAVGATARTARDLAGDGIGAVRDLAGDGLGAARDLASKAPVVGGLFD